MTEPLEKVFLALRTDIFNVPDEHITLKYFKSASMGQIVRIVDDLAAYIPTEIELNGFANYRAGQMFYEVALVDRFKNPHLWAHTTLPHITIRKSQGPLSNATFEPAFYGTIHEIVTQIYLGKTVKGKVRWMPIETYNLNGSVMGLAGIKAEWDRIMEEAIGTTTRAA
jgi:hypothetical protein